MSKKTTDIPFGSGDTERDGVNAHVAQGGPALPGEPGRPGSGAGGRPSLPGEPKKKPPKKRGYA